MLASLFEEPFDDPPLLIDFDGENAAVGPGIVKFVAGLGESARELPYAGAQDAREAQEDGGVDAAALDCAGELEEIRRRAAWRVRVDLEVPVFVDGEKSRGPGGDLVEVGTLGRGPAGHAGSIGGNSPIGGGGKG